MYLERVEKLDDIGCGADVNEEQLRQLLSRQVAFWQKPPANDEDEH